MATKTEDAHRTVQEAVLQKQAQEDALPNGLLPEQDQDQARKELNDIGRGAVVVAEKSVAVDEKKVDEVNEKEVKEVEKQLVEKKKKLVSIRIPFLDNSPVEREVYDITPKNSSLKFSLIEVIDRDDPKKSTTWLQLRKAGKADAFEYYAVDAKRPFVEIAPTANEPKRRMIRVWDPETRTFKYYDPLIGGLWSPEELDEEPVTVSEIQPETKEAFSQAVESTISLSKEAQEEAEAETQSTLDFLAAVVREVVEEDIVDARDDAIDRAKFVFSPEGFDLNELEFSHVSYNDRPQGLEPVVYLQVPTERVDPVTHKAIYVEVARVGQETTTQLVPIKVEKPVEEQGSFYDGIADEAARKRTMANQVASNFAALQSGAQGEQTDSQNQNQAQDDQLADLYKKVAESKGSPKASVGSLETAQSQAQAAGVPLASGDYTGERAKYGQVLNYQDTQTQEAVRGQTYNAAVAPLSQRLSEAVSYGNYNADDAIDEINDIIAEALDLRQTAANTADANRLIATARQAASRARRARADARAAQAPAQPETPRPPADQTPQRPPAEENQPEERPRPGQQPRQGRMGRLEQETQRRQADWDRNFEGLLAQGYDPEYAYSVLGQRPGDLTDEQQELERARLERAMERFTSPVPQVVYVGFESGTDFIRREREQGRYVSLDDLANEFHNQYQELIDRAPNRDASREFELSLRGAVSYQFENITNEEGVKIGVKLTMKRRNDQGQEYDEVKEFYIRDGGAAKNNLIIAQHVAIEFQQKQWVKEKLDLAARYASSEQDLERSIREIQRVQPYLLGDELNKYLDSISILYTSLQRFRKNGVVPGSEFGDVAHILMNLPGVSEALAEFERREFTIRCIEENGRIRMRTDDERAQIIEELKRQDRANGGHGDDGVYNVTSVGGLRDPVQVVRYEKIVENVIHNAGKEFDRWKLHEGKDSLREKIARARDPELKFELQKKLANLSNEVTDRTSVQVAEGIWRIAGRASFFGDNTGQGQDDMYQISNFGKWTVEKDKGKGNNAMMRISFGTNSREDVGKWGPGQMGGANLHTGWYGYFTDYAIFAPGKQIKGALVQAGIDRDVSPADKRVVDRLRTRFFGGDLEGLTQEEVFSKLTNEEKQTMARWNFAPGTRISLDNWRNISDNQSVWNDWDDFKGDYEKAKECNKILTDFLLKRDGKTIKQLYDKYWNRYWKWRGEGSRRAIEAMVEYRQRFNKEEEGLPNWDAKLIDRAITNAFEAGVLELYEKPVLEEEFFAKRVAFQPFWPITLFRKEPWMIKFSRAFGGLAWIWGAKYHRIPRRHGFRLTWDTVTKVFGNYKNFLPK